MRIVRFALQIARAYVAPVQIALILHPSAFTKGGPRDIKTACSQEVRIEVVSLASH